MEFPQAANMLLCRGSIFHGDIFPNIDHGKFFAVIGEDGENLIGAFFINSSINTNIIRNDEQQNLQIPLTNVKYSFLTKDHSFLNCAELVLINKNKLKEHIDNGRVTFKDSLTYDDLAVILEKLMASSLYSKADKDSFFS
jgi:hypothetical protein